MLTIHLAPGARALAGYGPVLAVILSGPQGEVRTSAMVDTGSSISSADEGLLAQIGVEPCGTRQVDTVAGTVAIPLYTAEIRTAQGQLLAGGRCKILGNRLPGEPEVLLGRDVLITLHLHYDGPGGAWSLEGDGAARPALPLWQIAAYSAVGSVIGYAVTAGLRGLFRQRSP